MRHRFEYLATIIICTLMLTISISAQTTAFTYQGNLNLSGTPANGNYDFVFVLFDAVSGGSQISVAAPSNVPVSNGLFSVAVDFGAYFSGASRFMEISVRPVGGGAWTTLTPRQEIKSTPYSIRSISSQSADIAVTATSAVNATQLGGIPAANYVVYGAATINAGSQFNIGGSRVFSVGGTRNTFLGINSGTISPNGFATDNSFFGFNTGAANNIGGFNAFFGSRAGQANTDGGANSFFGAEAGLTNSTGDGNSFFGRSAGKANTIGDNNSFFGATAGDVNTSGNFNSFYGGAAGGANTTGSQNSFFGRLAGQFNVSGGNNAFFGFEAGKASTASNNAFFGGQAGPVNTTGSGNSFFGSIVAQANTIGADNSFFGVNSGRDNTEGNRNTFIGRISGRYNTTGNDNTFIGSNTASSNVTGSNNTAIGANANVANGLSFATAVGSGSSVSSSNSVVIGRNSDTVRVGGTLNASGTINLSDNVFMPLAGTGNSNGEQVCWDSTSNRIMDCVSSIIFKKNVFSYENGLEIVKVLRPVFFEWKIDGHQSIGFIAEEVGLVEPRLTTKSKSDEIRGVNYDSIAAVTVSAIQVQQAQIEAQKAEIDALKQYICSRDQAAPFCKEK